MPRDVPASISMGVAALDRFAPARSLLAGVALVAGGCHRDGGASDGGGGSSGSGGPDPVGIACPGVAYTRTDVPGTALCLDGLDTFECAWTSNNPAFNGYLVQGSHDATEDLLTLAFPDDVARTSFTSFTFDVFYGVDGVDLVLRHMGVRAGDFREVASWAEAVAGDGGLCGGHGSACDGPCASDADCGGGAACMATEDGDKCLPIACDGCFDADEVCNYYADTCEFGSCSAAAFDG